MYQGKAKTIMAAIRERAEEGTSPVPAVFYDDPLFLPRLRFVRWLVAQGRMGEGE